MIPSHENKDLSPTLLRFLEVYRQAGTRVRVTAGLIMILVILGLGGFLNLLNQRWISSNFGPSASSQGASLLPFPSNSSGATASQSQMPLGLGADQSFMIAVLSRSKADRDKYFQENCAVNQQAFPGSLCYILQLLDKGVMSQEQLGLGTASPWRNVTIPVLGVTGETFTSGFLLGLVFLSFTFAYFKYIKRQGRTAFETFYRANQSGAEHQLYLFMSLEEVIIRPPSLLAQPAPENTSNPELRKFEDLLSTVEIQSLIGFLPMAACALIALTLPYREAFSSLGTPPGAVISILGLAVCTLCLFALGVQISNEVKKQKSNWTLFREIAQSKLEHFEFDHRTEEIRKTPPKPSPTATA